jgi:hypothetical protein
MKALIRAIKNDGWQWLDTWHAEYIASVKPSTVVSYAQHIKNHLKQAHWSREAART